MSRRTLVIGAGISGLVAALRLQDAGRSVSVVDTRPRTGGVISTVEEDGYLFEIGPNSWPSTAKGVAEIIERVGIQDQVIEASQGEAVHLEALTVQHGIGALGGAMTVIDGSLTLDHVTFRANDGVYGGALYLEDANLVATGTSWVDNTASHYGGAAYVEYSTVDVQQSRFAGNFVGNTHGGALYSYATDLSLSNSVIADNDAIQGGALYLTGSDQDYDNDGLPDRTSATLDFLTGVHNAGVSLGAFMRKGYADVVLSNSIVAHNRDNVAISLSDGTGYTQYTTLTADNDVRDFGNFDPGTEPQTGDLNGNIVDGLTDFVSRTDDGDWTNDDLHLLDTSEARDAGDPLLQDPDGSPADMGAYGGPNGDW